MNRLFLSFNALISHTKFIESSFLPPATNNIIDTNHTKLSELDRDDNRTN